MRACSGKTAVLGVLVMAPFMAQLDASILNVALPQLAKALGVPASTVAWAVSSYMIVISALILPCGRLGDIFGHTRTFLLGIGVFTFGSLLCGLSHTFYMLLGARVVQAVGSAAFMANNQGIITALFPASQRGHALGVNAAFVALGTLLGPPLGGFLIEYANWQSLFFINLPIGLGILLVGLRLLPQTAVSGGSMDLSSTLLSAGGICLFFLSLVQLHAAVGFGLVGIGISALILTAFFRRQKKLTAPFLPPAVLKNRRFMQGVTCTFLSYTAIACSNLILPFYFQDLLGISARNSGLILLLYPAVLAFAAPLGGSLSDRFGAQRFTILGLVLAGTGLLLMNFAGLQNAVVACFCMVLMACGNGLFQSPNNNGLMSALSGSEYGIGGSINALMRNLGNSTGVVLSLLMLYGGMRLRLGYSVSGFFAGGEAAFLFGMRLAYTTVSLLTFGGAFIAARKTKA